MCETENKTSESASDTKGLGTVGEGFKKASPAKSRIWELDFLRGVCVLLMVFDHIMYDFAYIFGNHGGLWYGSAGYAGSAAERIAVFALSFWKSSARDAVQPIIAGLFIVLSGISSGFSKSNLKRGARLAVFALLLTLVTSLLNSFIAGTAIRFGVLHMLAASMLLFGAVELALRSLNADQKFKHTSLIVYVLIGFLLLFLGLPYAGDAPLESGGGLLPYLVYVKTFFKKSADYFPMLPWSGLMFLGAALGKIVYRQRRSVFGNVSAGLEKYTMPVLFVGRRAVWFYLLHQVFVFTLLYLFGMIAGY